MPRNILNPGADVNQAYGVGGIKGDRFSSVAGWEKFTSGFAGNIYTKLASENGIQPVDPAITGAREPFKVGKFIIKLLRNVPWFDETVMHIWRYIIEDTSTALEGINDYTFETFQRPHGAIRQNSTYGGMFKETNGEFNITVYETAGQLVRKAIDYWLYGLSDPKTAVAHFYGKDVRDLQPNKSMSIMYILLGPTCRPQDIEYACIWHDALITAPRHTHNNSGTLGEAGSGVDITLNFQGTFDRSPEVDKLAAIIVDREGLYEERSYNSLLPKYIYDEYFINPPDKADHNITIANRLSLEISSEVNKNGLSGAYEAASQSTHNKLIEDEDKLNAFGNNGLGESSITPGTANPLTVDY
jgi:hypothetical protein